MCDNLSFIQDVDLSSSSSASPGDIHQSTTPNPGTSSVAAGSMTSKTRNGAGGMVTSMCRATSLDGLPRNPHPLNNNNNNYSIYVPGSSNIRSHPIHIGCGMMHHDHPLSNNAYSSFPVSDQMSDKTSSGIGVSSQTISDGISGDPSSSASMYNHNFVVSHYQEGRGGITGRRLVNLMSFEESNQNAMLNGMREPPLSAPADVLSYYDSSHQGSIFWNDVSMQQCIQSSMAQQEEHTDQPVVVGECHHNQQQDYGMDSKPSPALTHQQQPQNTDREFRDDCSTRMNSAPTSSASYEQEDHRDAWIDSRHQAEPEPHHHHSCQPRQFRQQTSVNDGDNDGNKVRPPAMGQVSKREAVVQLPTKPADMQMHSKYESEAEDGVGSAGENDLYSGNQLFRRRQQHSGTTMDIVASEYAISDEMAATNEQQQKACPTELLSNSIRSLKLSQQQQLNNNQPQQQQQSQNHQCENCDKQFSSKSALAKHRLIHSKDRKYVCPSCSKSFKRQDHLNGHVLTHMTKKPFFCKVPSCIKSYCDSRSLKRHIESQHQHLLADILCGNQQAKSFLPPIDAIYVNVAGEVHKISLSANHATNVSNELNNLSEIVQKAGGTAVFSFEEPKPISCAVCSKRFKNMAALYGHMRLHGGYAKVQDTHPEVVSVQYYNRHQQDDGTDTKSSTAATDSKIAAQNRPQIMINSARLSTSSMTEDEERFCMLSNHLSHSLKSLSSPVYNYGRYRDQIYQSTSNRVSPGIDYSPPNFFCSSNNSSATTSQTSLNRPSSGLSGSYETVASAHDSNDNRQQSLMGSRLRVYGIGEHPYCRGGRKVTAREPRRHSNSESVTIKNIKMNDGVSRMPNYFSFFVDSKQNLSMNFYQQFGEVVASSYTPPPMLISGRHDHKSTDRTWTENSKDGWRKYSTPHINVGPAFQAQIPDIIESPLVEPVHESQLWDPQKLIDGSLSMETVQAYINFSQSVFVSGPYHIEMALTVLNFADGDVSKAAMLLIRGHTVDGEECKIPTLVLDNYRFPFSTSWTDEEVSKFKELLAEQKDLPAIASSLGSKTLQDCVEMYYVSRQAFESEAADEKKSK